MAYPEKRGKVWRVRYKRADGTYGTDPTKYATKTAADQRCEEIEAAQRKGTFVDPTLGQTTLDEYVDKWFKRMRFQPHNAQTKRSLYKCHIQARFGAAPLVEIQRPAVQEWVNGIIDRIDAGELKTRTLEASYGLLKEILTDAEVNEYIQKNPCRAIKRPSNKADETVHAMPRQIRAITSRMEPWAELPAIVAAWTGMRWGEVTGALRTSFDPDEKVLYADNRLEPGTLKDGAPRKGMSNGRRIVLPTFLVELISAYLMNHDSKYLFPSQRGKILRPKAFYAQWDQYADQFVPGLTFHGLRHSAKTWMIEDEVPEVLQYRQLGHTPKDVAGIYAHVTPKMEKHLRKAFDKRWKQTGGDTDAIMRRWRQQE